MNEDRKYLIGFDLGGTKMLAGLLNRELEITARNKEKIKDGSDGEEVFSQIVKCLKELLEKSSVKPDHVAGVGIAIPGPIDLATGVVLETPNLGFRDFPLKARLEKEVGIPVFLENDVNAGTYGEYRKGALAGYHHVLGLFPGTGIGGGIILDGKLYRGATGGAGEIGHMIIQVDGRLCGCGHYGCLEAHASKTAMAKDAAMLATTGGAPVMAGLTGGDISKMKSSVFARSIEGGDTQVARVLDRAARFFGIGLANCVNIFNPEAIVVGGGLVERFGETYLATAEATMRENAMPSLAKVVKILPAQLGDDAAVIGAASLLEESLAGRT